MPDSLPSHPMSEHGDARARGGEGGFLPEELQLDTTNIAPTWESSLKRQLDAMMRHSLLETTQLGLMVWDLDADSCLYRYGERQRLRPASTMKLITAITALDYLGSEYRLTTELRYKGDITMNADSTRTLQAIFYCVGGLDPMFSNSDMSTLVSSISALGADTIRGTICADRSFKDDKLLGEGWCWDDDNPVLSPLLVGRKDVFASSLYKGLQGKKMVAWLGTTDGISPSDAKTLCRVEHGMDEVLGPMLKKSDNLYAEALFYQIAHRRGGRNASAKVGRQQAYEVMRKAGLNTTPYYVADGSGLSLYNYLTAECEVMMLRYAYKKPDIYASLYKALPIAGTDGTIASRMTGKATRGNVRAKTGTVNGISSLAGYCRGGNGHMLCFSIINQGVRSSADGHRFQDALCETLCK